MCRATHCCTRAGGSKADREGFSPKQMLARVDDDTKFFLRQIMSYSEFPPLVPPIVAKQHSTHSKSGNFVQDTTAKYIREPLLHPHVEGNTRDQELYSAVCERLGIDPSLQDDFSYRQVMTYCNMAYLELLPPAPHLIPHWT